eukprot:TRINITY_DN649_c0_g1_i1.p1 TRINITY_DN649_c0_g1~~TRINITY_DN649_c0_g1_i1.p1  ORF type:complete len:154 (-),score=32.85 TRINITY_DN649_c0_g1_i1:77-538(-)
MNMGYPAIQSENPPTYYHQQAPQQHLPQTQTEADCLLNKRCDEKANEIRVLDAHSNTFLIDAANKVHHFSHKIGYVFFAILLFPVIPFNAFAVALFELTMSLFLRPWMKVIDHGFNGVSIRTTVFMAFISFTTMYGIYVSAVSYPHYYYRGSY